jgi:hypothetical protein
MAFLRSTDWVLPGVLLSYFVGMHYPAFFGAERLRHVLPVFATFTFFFIFFETRTVLVGWKQLGYYLAVSISLLEYTRPPKHMTGKGHLMWRSGWRVKIFKRWMRFFHFFFLLLSSFTTMMGGISLDSNLSICPSTFLCERDSK